MQDNPYQALVQAVRSTVRELQPQTILTGEVLSIAPLRISAGNLLLDGTDLLLNAALEISQGSRVALLYTGDAEDKFIILCKVVEG